MANNTQIDQDDWLLFDVGAQVSRYTADIARTVPLGLVTDRQAAVYQALIRVHERTAALLRAGQNIRSFLAETDAAMMHELVELKLIQPGDTQAYRRYFPHAIGHGLGLDPHDALGQPEVFAEHMVMTVEPGIYIPEEGIGMRIESVVHITANGPLLMSSALPVELAELQSLIG